MLTCRHFLDPENAGVKDRQKLQYIILFMYRRNAKCIYLIANDVAVTAHCPIRYDFVKDSVRFEKLLIRCSIESPLSEITFSVLCSIFQFQGVVSMLKYSVRLGSFY